MQSTCLIGFRSACWAEVDAGALLRAEVRPLLDTRDQHDYYYYYYYPGLSANPTIGTVRYYVLGRGTLSYGICV